MQLALIGLAALAGTTLPEPEVGPAFTAGRTAVHLHAALGARWTAWVGDEAELASLDAVANPQVALAQSALEARLEAAIDPSERLAAQALLRVEEGLVHAGGLEAAEAWVGLAALDGVIAVRMGRDDLPVTRDRVTELETQPHATRPALSRTVLPLHVDGVTASAGWPGVAEVEGGLAWSSRTADAPFQWARVGVAPLAPVRAEDGPWLDLGASWLRHASPTLGSAVLWAVDGEARWWWLRLAGGWQRFERGDSVVGELLAEAGLAVPLRAAHRLALDLRGERLTGLLAGEEDRWLGTGRLAWQHADDPAVTGYVEALLSREPGTTQADADLLVLDDRLERRNDAVALGLLFHW